MRDVFLNMASESRYARHFDIDWSPTYAAFLGDTFDAVLENGEIAIGPIPLRVNPRSPIIMIQSIIRLRRRRGSEAEILARYR